MPRYVWKCDECCAEVEVTRGSKQIDVPPTEAEYSATRNLEYKGELEICIHRNTTWTRILSRTAVKREPNWGKKGAW